MARVAVLALVCGIHPAELLGMTFMELALRVARAKERTTR